MIGWWRRRRAQASCFHHDRVSGKSWVETVFFIDYGRKLMRCTRCGKKFIL